MIKKFEAQNPGVSIQFQTYKPTEYNTVLSAAMQAGKGPDIVHLRAYGALQPFARPEFLLALPQDLDNAARLDGAGEFGILLRVLLPLVRPALAIVTVYNIIPIWNDFFFPLVFIHQDAVKTLPLGLTVFFGQYQTNWALLFAGLTLAAAPILGLYVAMSRQFIKGLTAGAVKG